MEQQLLILKICSCTRRMAHRWFSGNMILFALCESVVVYGLTLRFVGATLRQAAPFYLAGIVLLILFRPRKP